MYCTIKPQYTIKFDLSSDKFWPVDAVLSVIEAIQMNGSGIFDMSDQWLTHSQLGGVGWFYELRNDLESAKVIECYEDELFCPGPNLEEIKIKLENIRKPMPQEFWLTTNYAKEWRKTKTI